MSQKHKGQPAPTQPRQNTDAPASTQAPKEEAMPTTDMMPTLWKVLGVSAVLVALLVVYGVYHHVQHQIASLKSEIDDLSKELRADLGRLSQSYVGLVKKEEHTTRIRTVWDTIKELRADRSDLTVMKERCAVLADLYKGSEAERKALADQISKLREKTRADEDKKELTRQIQTIRERIAQMEGKPGVAGTAEESEKP